MRFETPPGKQLQIDFGERRAMIGDENVKVYLFVATLGYSRRLYVRPFLNERQKSWFAGMEGAFRHVGGVTEECCSTTIAGWSLVTTG
jgi:transposase